MLKQIIETLLGVGKGWIGSLIRVGLAGLSGWLVSKGIDVDAGTIGSLQDFLLGISGAILTYVASILNNKVTS